VAGALLFRLRALVALVVLLAVFSILSPAFLTAGNLTILLKHVAINAIMAVGMTFVILSGGIDLSVGSVAGLAGMVAGGLIDRGLVLPMFGVAGAFLAARTPFGQHVYAVGGNERAAQLSGVRVKRIQLQVYVISGVCSAVVGLIIASQLASAHPATGQSFELNAIAAVVLGGTSLMGGRGSIGGTIIGALVIGALADGLVLLGVSEFWQIVIKGIVIIVAVVLDQLQRRLQWQPSKA
jgi:erythritol transport system permease protein